VDRADLRLVVFMFALYGALLCMVTIVRKQWFENERLPFPLAQIQLALVDQPERGRWLSELMSKRSFWIAFFVVFLLHVWNGLSRYSPKHFAEIWVWYDFNKLMGNAPWIYADPKLKNAAVFFTVVGVTYFLSSSVAFSLWFFFIANNVFMMLKGTWTGESRNYGRQDEHLGGLIAFMISFLWVGRHHWKLVIAQAFRGTRAGEPRERYLPYAAAFWGFIGCTLVMIGFLWLAGCTWPAAIVTVALVLTGFLIITRIIAETGLVHGSVYISFVKPWMLTAFYAKSGPWLHPVPVKSFYLGAMVEIQHYDYREVMPVYATHALKVADETILLPKESAEQARRLNEQDKASPSFSRGACSALSPGRGLLALMALSLVIGYFTSFYSMLWTEYHYAWTKDVPGKLVNDHGVQGLPEGKLQLYPESYDKSEYYYKHEPLAHMTFGFAFTGSPRVPATCRYAWWPLHPIGFLMIVSTPARTCG
jgi:hypothetical protein